MKGYCTALEEWLYPDQELGELPQKITLHTAKNGCESIKILLKSDTTELPVLVTGESGFSFEIFEMLDVRVGYNEVETEEQSGMFVITQKEYEKPVYCTRKAPFRVYEALKPIIDSTQVKNGRAAVYITVAPKEKISAGEHSIEIKIGDYSLSVSLVVHDVEIPKESLGITNWFSLDTIAQRHNLQIGTKEYYDMLRLYARAMRRTRQTHFFISYDPKRVTKDIKGLSFDFSYLKPIIELFFSEGFKTMEFGDFGCRGDNFFTEQIKCRVAPEVDVSSGEGYYIMQAFIKQLSDFLKENGWAEKTIFHVFDEPDVHMKTPQTLELRKQQYFRITNLLRRYIPGCRIIEAVKTAEFKSGVDIWVPLTANYEELKEDFDRLIKAGEEVWTYVCCVPSGHHLNRFLDIELLKSRLLFWGFSKYSLSGYLHWGFNYWPESDYNPFEESNTPNVAFNGIYPSGDAYIVFPGENGPLIGLRLEAQRRGAEDYELLQLLKKESPQKYEELLARIFRKFNDYNSDVEIFEETRIGILKLLEKNK